MDFFVDLGALSYKTLKAAKSFFQGEILIDLTTAEEVSEPDYRSIDLGDKHVYHPIARYVNHSCEPNAYVDSQQQKLIANSSINKNDEILCVHGFPPVNLIHFQKQPTNKTI